MANNGASATALTTISGTTIAGNESTGTGAPGRGGGMFEEAGRTLISGSTIENNLAVNRGGGIYTEIFKSSPANAVLHWLCCEGDKAQSIRRFVQGRG
jgi:predicted outer membrane repeat protein